MKLDEVTARRSFLGALLVLVVNDWFLKGAGLLPGGVTGKLSDVAGMIVAPVVLVALLALARVPGVARRVAAVGLIAATFAAIKLDALWAQRFDAAVNAALGALSFPLVAHTTVDPTDLVALPLLGAGVWIAERLVRDPLLHRSGALVAGLLACAATSPTYMRLDPHWGVAGTEQGRLWGARVANGAVVVQVGRRSSDGDFEVRVELAARDGDLALDVRDVFADLPSRRVAAQLPDGEPASVRASPGQTASVRYIFHTGSTDWSNHAQGVLNLTITDGGRPRSLWVGLSFEERMVPWRKPPELR